MNVHDVYLKMAIVDLQDVSTGRALNIHREFNSSLHNADFTSGNVHLSHFCGQEQRADLRHDQEIAVRVVHALVPHRSGCGVYVNGESRLHLGLTSTTHQAQTLHEIVGARGVDLERSPAQLVGVGDEVLLQARLHAPERAMHHRGPDPIEPSSLVDCSWDSECCPGQLLGV